MNGHAYPRGRVNNESRGGHPDGYEADVDASIDESLNVIRSINLMNNTVAAVWDLGSPNQSNPTLASRQRRTESLGMFGDRRAKVAEQHIRPGGKYRSICKLIMGYSRSSGTEYMATGWLIEDDIVVTAGHCLYDSKGGYLQYIKAYVGYIGPESAAKRDKNCQMRLGKFAAAPVEYIKTYGLVHDVGFIQLERPFDGITPFRFEDTPVASKGMDLGVVGYPGDINDGNEMYEHWAVTKIDVARNGFLSYEIDTANGESGSPILQRTPHSGEIRPIGVHAEGGFPNYGSVIGPYGNTFSDYTTALAAKGTNQPWPNTKKIPTGAPSGIRNLEYISISSSKTAQTSPSDYRSGGLFNGVSKTRGKEHGRIGNPYATQSDGSGSQSDGSGSAVASSSHVDALREMESMVNPHQDDEGIHDTEDADLGGGSRSSNDLRDFIARNRNRETAPRKYGTAIMCTHIPEKMATHAFKESGAMTARTQEELLDAASAKRKADPDLQTTFFVNFKPDGLQGKALVELNRVVDNVKLWQSWASSLSAIKTQEKIDSGALSNAQDGRSKAKRSTYTSVVFDYLMRGSTWFAKTQDETQTRHFRCQTTKFHRELIDVLLAGFSVPNSVFNSLHGALSAISSNIEVASKTTDDQQMQYFIMLTRYEWQDASQTVQPVIRVINFKTDASLTKYTVLKSSYEDIKLDFTYNQYQCDFNNEIFSQLRGKFNNTLVTKGGDFMEKANTIDIDVPSDFKESYTHVNDTLNRPVEREFVEHDIATFERIVESLEIVSQGGVDLDSSPFETAALEVVDAGIAAQIGTRLVLQAEQFVRQGGFVKDIDTVVAKYPAYWQYMGSLIFKQLFPKIPMPASLRFWDEEAILRKEITKWELSCKALETVREQLRLDVRDLQTKLDSQKSTVTNLQGLVSVCIAEHKNGAGVPKEIDELKTKLAKAQEEKKSADAESRTLLEVLETDKRAAEQKNRDLELTLSSTREQTVLAMKPRLSGTVKFADGNPLSGYEHPWFKVARTTTTVQTRYLVPSDTFKFIHGISRLISKDTAQTHVLTRAEMDDKRPVLYQEARDTPEMLENDYLTFPDIGASIQIGSITEAAEASDTIVKTISFETAYPSVPEVVVWLQGFHVQAPKQGALCQVSDVTTTSFKLTVYLGVAGSKMTTCGWMAYDKSAINVQSGTYVHGPVGKTSPDIFFRETPFSHSPNVFMALRDFALGEKIGPFSCGVINNWVTPEKMWMGIMGGEGSAVDFSKVVVTWVAIW
ncbi:hypothetical protein BDV95DRAFT_558920 [Massariosphaeria phaeospora]|uniref:Serine protease n=1 Tax=Massariosphaeria phaeospora TaxID=100035 RepID=A0A7C8MFZ5_9PLEO|nr:hypothetical protein BDV95DRAFT_558920 [Massariosphaeria phaeospora]